MVDLITLVDDEERLCRRRKTKDHKETREPCVIRSHAISGSIGRLGENNEVNGSAAPPSSKQDSPDLQDETEQRDNTRTDCVDDRDIGFDSRPRPSPISLSILQSVSLPAWPLRPLLSDTILCLQTLRQQWFCASQSLLCQSTKAKLSTSHRRAPHPAQSQSLQSLQTPPFVVTVTVTATASCMLLAGNCASHRLASPCLALHT